MLKPTQDAFGQAIYAWLYGEKCHEIIERDDGYIDILYHGIGGYFSEYKKWPSHERQAIRFARGRVLDIGCGAGRCCLYLQQKGLDVLGIDISPLAVATCRNRGVEQAKALSITQVTDKLGIFDTIIMYGNNFGLFGSFTQAEKLLKRLYKLTSPSGRLIVEAGNPHRTKLPEHLAYQRANKKRGRMPGQIRLRFRYKNMKTTWYDYLLVSPDEMQDILKGTGWKIVKLFDQGAFTYTAVIEKNNI